MLMHRRITSLFFLTLLIACNERNGNTDEEYSVAVNADEYEVIEFSKAHLVELQSDKLVKSVEDIFFLDSLVVIRGGNGVYSFDHRGGLIADYSMIGRGPTEHLRVWDAGAHDGEIWMYDIDLKRILYFSAIGDFIRCAPLAEKASDNPFQSICSLGEGHYVGKRIFGAPGTVELSKYDAGFNYSGDYVFEDIRSGIHLWRQFAPSYDDGALYNKYFSNIIYSVSPDSLYVKYHIDFGNHTFTMGDKMDDEYECIEFLNNHKDRYASMISSLFESDSVFAFQYVFRGYRCVAVYDRLSRKTTNYRIVPDGMEAKQAVYHNGSIYAVLENEAGYLFLAENKLI